MKNYKPATVAAALLVRPSDFGATDDRLYTTHAPVIAWAEQSDDKLSESNYRTVLAHLQSFEHECDGDAHPVDCHEGCERVDVLDAGIHHWAAGQCSQLFVRVYEPACPRCLLDVEHSQGSAGLLFLSVEDGSSDCLDANGWHEAPAFTAAWVEACKVLEGLSDYPVFDESDFSELEYEEWERQADEAIRDASRDHGDDSTEDDEAIVARLYQALATEESRLVDAAREQGENGDADYGAVTALYEHERGAYFEARAREILFGQCEGQLTLT